MPKDVYTEYVPLPGHEQRVEEIIRGLTTAAASEPGILRFLPYSLEGLPRRYFVLESYLNEQAFEVHLTSDRRRSFVEEIIPHIQKRAPATARLNALC